MENIDKTVLIAGKDLPFGSDIADGMALAGYNVIVTGNGETDRQSISASNIVISSWNRPSSISARSLMLQAETKFSQVDESILYFDAELYAQQFPTYSAEECTRAVDTMILGYQYLCMEILTRLEQRKVAGKIIFLVRDHLSMEEMIRSSSAKSGTVTPTGPLVSSAKSAFMAFAENTAALMGDKSYVTILLVSVDSKNELSSKDSSLAAWLSEYLSALDKMPNKLTAKQSLKWIKAGANPPQTLISFVKGKFAKE
ncbi:MAG: hypothetical protein IJR49_02105 [Treponema sp.]|nr:hypothetical protein [Treponema sp.]